MQSKVFDRLTAAAAVPALALALAAGPAPAFAQSSGAYGTGSTPTQNSNGAYDNNGSYNGGYNSNGPRSVSSQRIAVGTQVKLKLLQEVTSANARPGDSIRAVVASDDKSGIPAGTVLIGRVTQAKAATPSNGGALGIKFGLTDENTDSSVNTARESSNNTPVTYGDIASTYITGRDSHGQGHATGAAAAGGALIGLLRKGKLGDAVEGAAVGAVGGTVYDQAQKKSAQDVELKTGSEITVKLDRPLATRLTVAPADY